MLEYGLWAAGALDDRARRSCRSSLASRRSCERARRAATPEPSGVPAVLALAVAVFGLYTAVKAAYLSTVFGTRVAERNLIYLAPLLFVGDGDLARAAAPAAGRARGRGGLRARACCSSTPLRSSTRTSRRPGSRSSSPANRELELPRRRWRRSLLVAFARRPRARGRDRAHAQRAPAVSAVLAVVVAVGRARAGTRPASCTRPPASNTAADSLDPGLPRPADAGSTTPRSGAPTLYLGQQVTNANGDLAARVLEPLDREGLERSTAPRPRTPARSSRPTSRASTARSSPTRRYRTSSRTPGSTSYGTDGRARRRLAALPRLAPPLRLRTSITGVYARRLDGRGPERLLRLHHAGQPRRDDARRPCRARRWRREGRARARQRSSSGRW